MPLHDVVSERILVLAPLGADARNTSRALIQANHSATPCGTVEELCQGIDTGCAALVMTEEAIVPSTSSLLREAFRRQPPWSDLPVVLITSGGKMSEASYEAEQRLGSRCYVTLLERPLRVATLVASVKSAVRARLRQYEIRDLLLEREKLLSSLEERVSERTAKLQETVEQLEAFSYSVSHDLRAPLRALQSYSEILVADYGETLNPEAQGHLARIQKAASRMEQLTRDLLTYSRVSGSDVSLSPVQLDTLLRDVVDQYPLVSVAREHIHIHTPLGVAMGQASLLLQCFSNLIENALKFVPSGTVPDVHVQSECADRRIRIYVKDNGMGIDPVHHARIFSIFERVHDQTIPGTGIGLAIVKKAVARMAGSVSVTSSVNQGSVFCIELPMAA